MPTIRHVAEHARVSTATVSAVLNRSSYVSPELTARMKEAVEALDYTINELARGLQTHQTKTIGMLVPEIISPFHATVVRGAEERLKRSGYSVLLGVTYDTPKEQSRYLSLFLAKQVDGLLVIPAPGDEKDIQHLVEKKRPVVFVSRPPRTFDADTIALDHTKCARMVTNHLIGRGHSRIAIITLSLLLTVGLDRVKGWRRALHKHKLPIREDYIRESDKSAESVQQAMDYLLNLDEPPTALYIGSMTMLPAVLRALKAHHLNCPDDFEVVTSHDSELLDVMSPPICGVDHFGSEIGFQSAELLLKRIRHPNRRAEKILLAPKLKIRG